MLDYGRLELNTVGTRTGGNVKDSVLRSTLHGMVHTNAQNDKSIFLREGGSKLAIAETKYFPF